MSRRHALIVAAACWGFGTVVSKEAVQHFPPVTLLVIQLAASLVLLGAVARFRIARVPHRLGALGILNPGVAYLLSLAGLVSIDAGLSVLLWAVEPVMVILIAWCWLGDRPSGRQSALVVVAVVGAGVASFAGAGRSHVAGILLTVGAVACCALYTVVADRWMETDATLGVVIAQQLWAVGPLGGLVLVGAAKGLLEVPAVGAMAWASAIGSGVLYYGVAFWAFLTGLRATSTTTAAVSLTLIPVFGLAAGAVFLGESISMMRAMAATVIVVAVVRLIRVTPLPTAAR